jgi:hypothetical protein
MLSASCRIDARGSVECWRADLRRTPRGRYVLIDENGSDACAIREDGTVSCWGHDGEIPGIGARGAARDHDWSRVPAGVTFRTVSVGLFRSPYDANHELYACGISQENEAVCWEQGADGHVFRLRGRFQSVEAGEGVCAINVEGLLECWASWRENMRLEKMHPHFGYPVTPLRSFHLGVEAWCAVDLDGNGFCGGRHVSEPRDQSRSVGRVAVLRAGGSHGCGLRGNGEVVCVGDARPPPAGLRFRTLSEPAFLTDNYCGIGTDGIGYCWGDPSDDPTTWRRAVDTR